MTATAPLMATSTSTGTGTGTITTKSASPIEGLPKPLASIESEDPHPGLGSLLEQSTEGEVDSRAVAGPVGAAASSVLPSMATLWGWTKAGLMVTGAVAGVAMVSVVSAGAVVGLAPEASLRRAGGAVAGGLKSLVVEAANRARAMVLPVERVRERAAEHVQKAREHVQKARGAVSSAADRAKSSWAEVSRTGRSISGRGGNSQS